MCASLYPGIPASQLTYEVQDTARSVSDMKGTVGVRRKQVEKLISDVRRSSAVNMGQVELGRRSVKDVASDTYIKMPLQYHTPDTRRCRALICTT